VIPVKLNQRAVDKVRIVLPTQDGLEDKQGKQKDTNSSLKLYLHPTIQSVLEIRANGSQQLTGGP